MKILFCIPTLGEGGAERQLSYLGAQLSRMGHDVHVASSRGGSNLQRLRSNGVEWHRLGGISNRDPLIFFRLVALLRRLRPDIVQTILTPMDLMAGMAALLIRTPWILKESSSALLYGSDLRHRCRSLLGLRADGIVCNSAGGSTYWHSLGATRVLGNIRNGLPLDEIGEVAGDSATDLISQANAKVLVYAGRLDKGKNVDNLIIALSRLADQLSFVAFICGDGPRRRHLKSLAKKLGIADRLIFTGYISNLWALMKRADAVISLSRFEGCPNVVMEAMVCGAPLVVSDIHAHREIVDNSCALFVDAEDPEDAARMITEVLQNTNATSARVRAASARASAW
ncbi:MAG TPA: glycosyltransferase, partial [Pyrinomonadaceae bacterium]|nr:glycosyltransferase [Pyrinomonadaceae bacterium]